MSRIATLLLPLLVGCLSTATPPPEPFSDCRADDGDPYDIVSPDDEADPVRIEGDTLYVWVGHGGGCAQHDYQICWSGDFMESFPVQVHLEVWHDANDDTCEAYLTEELAFDLAPLREAYEDGYQTDEGEIQIHLDGHSVLYSFGG